MPWIDDFKQNSIMRMRENLPRINTCLEQLPEAVIWQKPVAAGNAMGNLVLHLCGNITQYIISGIGGAPDSRVRDAEFSATGGYDKAALLMLIRKTIEKATEVIGATTETGLLQMRMVQGFQLSGIGIIIHVTEHLSYHTGQIALFTKMHNNTDLGFYKNLDLNVRNEL
jgi:uncharacterized damage-inducible protein DinB